MAGCGAGDGQREREAGAALRFVPHPDLTTLRLHDVAGDGEPKSRAAALPRGVDLVEALEDAALLPGRDSRPGIGNADGHGVGFQVAGDAYLASLWRELDGIVQEVDQDAAHLVAIRTHLRDGGGRLRRQPQALAVG